MLFFDHENLKNLDAQKIAEILLKSDQCSFTMSDGSKRMANSDGSDQTAPSGGRTGSTLFAYAYLSKNFGSLW